MVIVELLFKVVLARICDALKLKDLHIVCPLRVYLARLSFDLSKLVFVVLGLDVFITTTSANIGSNALILLLY